MPKTPGSSRHPTRRQQDPRPVRRVARCASRRRRTVAVAALLAALSLAALASGCRSGKTAKVAKDLPPYQIVRPPVAFEMMLDAPEMSVLDLRSEAEFEGPSGHLHRAVNIPLAELERELHDLRFVELHEDDTFLVYCGGDDGCAEEGMRLLLEAGCEDAVLMEGGLEGWLAAGFGTVGRSDGGEEALPMPEDPGVRIPAENPSGTDRALPDPP